MYLLAAGERTDSGENLAENWTIATPSWATEKLFRRARSVSATAIFNKRELITCLPQSFSAQYGFLTTEGYYYPNSIITLDMSYFSCFHPSLKYCSLYPAQKLRFISFFRVYPELSSSSNSDSCFGFGGTVASKHTGRPNVVSGQGSAMVPRDKVFFSISNQHVPKSSPITREAHFLWLTAAQKGAVWERLSARSRLYLLTLCSSPHRGGPITEAMTLSRFSPISSGPLTKSYCPGKWHMSQPT